jgi:hypothetical protein
LAAAFFCHDKKTFVAGKGHFCSFLVSNIYWLTSLSADLGLGFPLCLDYLFLVYIVAFFAEKSIGNTLQKDK